MFWWEKANWPAKKMDEVLHPFFEDIRKLIFLLENPAAGNFDIYRFFGKSLDGNITYVPYDEQNWAGSWAGYAPPNLAKPGEITVVYKDHTGAEDIYVNWIEMSEAGLENHPPIQSDNTLDKRYWRLTTNPNYYCHYNHNAGKPKIKADGRYFVIHHAEKSELGQVVYEAYDYRDYAYKWLPRHTHPERQVAPVKYKSGIVKQRRDPALYGVEKKHKYITQNLGTQWPRDYADVYRRLTEYVKEFTEPRDEAVELAKQFAHDAKMCEAYQDRAIRTIEHEQQYLAKVDQTYIDAWTRRQGTEYNSGTEYFSGTEQWATPASIVYPPGGGAEGTRYLCIKRNTGNPPPNPTYWTTPAYRPDLCIYQPVYDAPGVDVAGKLYGARFFCCNGSAFEKVLKEVGHYDWWWDSACPFVPRVLTDLREVYPPAEWPLPCGCWRRTWRHSMGRVGALMWPGESGEPPEYYPAHWSVTQAVYDAANNPTNYRVVNNPPDFTLTEEQEEALKKRHDPRAVSTAKVNGATIIEPHYELHHDLVNDIYDALKELKLIDWTYPSWCWVKSGTNTNSGEYRDSSLTAYAAGRLSAIAARAWPWPNPNGWEGGMEETFGYDTEVRCHENAPLGPPKYNPDLVIILDEFALCLRVPKTGLLPGMLSGRLLLRVAWRGINTPNSIKRYTECVFGFGDKTLVGVPGDIEWNYAWVALQPGTVVESDDFYNYYWFYGHVLSPWPYTEKGGWMDWVWASDDYVRYAISQIEIRVPGWPGTANPDLRTSIDKRSIFEIDWDKAPKSVFTELGTNAIELKK